MDKLLVDEIERQVREIVAKHRKIDVSQVTNETRFGTDSDDCSDAVVIWVGIIDDLEKEFDIEIPEEDVKSIQTVQQTIDYIQKHSE